MHPRVLTGAVVLLAAACHRPGSARLEGHWRGTKADGTTTDVQPQANDFATDTELDFHGDVVAVKTPQGRLTGKYRVVREDKKGIVISTETDGPKDEQTFFFDDDRTMRWRVVEGKTISFHKD